MPTSEGGKRNRDSSLVRHLGNTERMAGRKLKKGKVSEEGGLLSHPAEKGGRRYREENKDFNQPPTPTSPAVEGGATPGRGKQLNICWTMGDEKERQKSLKRRLLMFGVIVEKEEIFKDPIGGSDFASGSLCRRKT